jgi:hypothetical protein
MDVSHQLHAPTSLTLGQNSGTCSIQGCVGPRASLDILEKRVTSWYCSDSNFRTHKFNISSCERKADMNTPFDMEHRWESADVTSTNFEAKGN